MKPNPQQLAVINHIDGPCLVTAVPGSGKTASTTERIKHLIQLGKDPSSILAITFTNKAADEMRSRITTAVGDKAAKITISTFHSLCSRILRTNAKLIGITQSYTIYDSDDSERLMKSCIVKIHGEDFTPSEKYWKGINNYIEGKRNNCLTHEQAVEKYDIDHNQMKVINEYFLSLTRANAVDFTGLLTETIRLFESHPNVLEAYQKRFLYINVDEVQDTNPAQYKLMKALSWRHRNILVVGDMDQCIFAFRGATPENVMQFEKEFGAKVLKLEKNYRSTPQILDAAHRVIQRNSLRIPTELETDNADGEIPRIVVRKTEYEMTLTIAQEIGHLIAKGIPPKEIAVLYRTNFVSRSVEQALRHENIKYRIIGGLSFYDRKEVKGCLSMLKLLCNPNDRIAFEKTVEACCKGVGPKTVLSLVEMSDFHSYSIVKAARQFTQGGGSHASKLSVLTEALDYEVRPSMALTKLAKNTAFWNRCKADSTTDNDRCANVQELIIDVERYMSEGGTLSGYLQSISLLSSSDEEAADKEVKLMTMHACKGLEFDHVFVSHCMQGMIPHARSLAVENPHVREEHIEEERRLFYVAMTRARQKLKMYFCMSRGIKGKKAEALTPSQFLHETKLYIPGVEEY